MLGLVSKNKREEKKKKTHKYHKTKLASTNQIQINNNIKQ